MGSNLNKPIVCAAAFFLLITTSDLEGREWWVDSAGTGDFATIQSAIQDTRVTHGDKVWVKEGLYAENLNYSGKNITIQSEMGPEKTTLSGSSSGTIVSFEQYETNQAKLIGFTLRDGNTYYGGAFFIHAASPTIRDCVIQHSYATYGGGVYTSSIADPVFENCSFIANSAGLGGGAVYAGYWSNPVFRDCEFMGNFSFTAGGAIYAFEGVVYLFNCYFDQNYSDSGGAVYLVDYSVLRMEDTTVRRCTANMKGGGVYVGLSSYATIKNSILWSNTAAVGAGLYQDSSGSGVVTASYSCIEDGSSESWFGAGCLDTDPFFVMDRYLCQVASGQSQDSPCLDAGDPTFTAPQGTTRTDGVPDVGRPDMGYHSPLATFHLAVNNLVSGATSTISLFYGSPNQTAFFAYSFAGPGPMMTPFGLASLSPPVSHLPLMLNASGQTTLYAPVPPGLSGLPVWAQAADVASGQLSNALALVVQ